jgi:hypothetical protein
MARTRAILLSREATPRARRARRALAWVALLALAAHAAAAPARAETSPAGARGAVAPPAVETSGTLAPDAAIDADPAAEVRLHKVKPRREKLPTLQFLKENRDFIRASLDRLREKPVEGSSHAAEIDPRFLAYREMLAAAAAAEDTAGAAADAHARRDLLENVTRLGEIEADLDRLERLLEEQRARLARLDQDFTGRQRTELMIVVSGHPAGAAITEIALAVGDGATLRVPLAAAQREALARGAIVQLFHGLVEPREQDLGVTLAVEGLAADSAFATIEPARDRLTMLRLDLSDYRPELGATSLRASIRQEAAGRAAVDG